MSNTIIKCLAEKKAKLSKDPLLDTAATHAQGWLVEGGDHEDVAEPVTGLTWKTVEEACGPEKTIELRRSARLSQARERDIDEDMTDPEDERIDEEEIEFESDQEEVIPMDYEPVGENDD